VQLELQRDQEMMRAKESMRR